MAEADFTIKAHDRLPSIKVMFAYRDATGALQPIDLTDVTGVTFIMRTLTGQTPKIKAAGTIESRKDGICRYDWIAADTDTPGSYVAEWQLTWVGGRTQTFPTKTYITIDILADLDGV